MDYLFSIFGFVIVYTIAYFGGFKLRPLIPKGKGFGMGFSLTMVLLAVLFLIDLMFPPVSNSGCVVATRKTQMNLPSTMLLDGIQKY